MRSPPVGCAPAINKAEVRVVVNGAEREVSELRVQVAERDAAINNLRTRLESAQVVVLGLRDEVREALRERDEWAERCRDLRARLAAAQNACASLPAPGGPECGHTADYHPPPGVSEAQQPTTPAIAWPCSGCGSAIEGCGYCLSSGVVCYDCADRAGVQFAPVALSTVTGADPSLLHFPAEAGPPEK